MVINKIDKIEFRLKQYQDLTWLKKYGTAFCAFDQTGSGCVCIGMQKDNKRYFCKIAGVDTVEAEISPSESVEILRNAVGIYIDLVHENLIKIIEHYAYNNLYAVIFEWSDGECLFDHWNFEKYSLDLSLKSPKERFCSLPIAKKLQAVDVLFSFLKSVSDKNYAAIDFYDGSIMYDFSTDTTTICDIDFFRKKPVINDVGEDWWGTKRLKAPEEYDLNADIDEVTNVFTLGALIFEFFGTFSKSDIEIRYIKNQFFPCAVENWQLSKECYLVVLKATEIVRNNRYKSILEFYNEWQNACHVK